MNLAHEYHLSTDEDHLRPGEPEFETHKNAWRGLLVLSIIALLAVILAMAARG
jgi:hypothetical protein